MDPRKNPYAPGAGSSPPELAGRSELLDRGAIALDRVRDGRHAKSMLLTGLRGVGKTVLLTRLREDATARGIVGTRVEAPEDRSLPAVLAPALRSALLALDRGLAAADLGRRAARALAGFVRAMKIRYRDIEITMPGGDEPGLADTGDLEHDLGELLETIAAAAKHRRTAFVLFVDELQYVPEEQLAALITALHRCAQAALPITLVGAGLPQLAGRMGKAKSYAERLFDIVEVGPLDAAAARRALAVPADGLGVRFEPRALDEIYEQSRGYPYFLQEWGKHAWDVAAASPITVDDVAAATRSALADLDASFFRVRFDRLTPAEKRYLRTMAALGPGPHRSGDIALKLGKPVTSLGPTRAKLIDKGMIYSPAHGDTAFTVPLFEGFMERMMPDRV